jgi:hypothetical protein
MIRQQDKIRKPVHNTKRTHLRQTYDRPFPIVNAAGARQGRAQLIGSGCFIDAVPVSRNSVGELYVGMEWLAVVQDCAGEGLRLDMRCLEGFDPLICSAMAGFQSAGQVLHGK